MLVLVSDQYQSDKINIFGWKFSNFLKLLGVGLNMLLLSFLSQTHTLLLLYRKVSVDSSVCCKKYLYQWFQTDIKFCSIAHPNSIAEEECRLKKC